MMPKCGRSPLVGWRRHKCTMEENAGGERVRRAGDVTRRVVLRAWRKHRNGARLVFVQLTFFAVLCTYNSQRHCLASLARRAGQRQPPSSAARAVVSASTVQSASCLEFLRPRRRELFLDKRTGGGLRLRKALSLPLVA